MKTVFGKIHAPSTLGSFAPLPARADGLVGGILPGQRADIPEQLRMSAPLLRRGETCGLKWEDLDLDEGLAYLSRQIQEGPDGRLRACPLKTGR